MSTFTGLSWSVLAKNRVLRLKPRTRNVGVLEKSLMWRKSDKATASGISGSSHRVSYIGFRTHKQNEVKVNRSTKNNTHLACL